MTVDRASRQFTLRCTVVDAAGCERAYSESVSVPVGADACAAQWAAVDRLHAWIHEVAREY